MIRPLLILLCVCNVYVAFAQSSVRQGKDYAVFFAVSKFGPGWVDLPYLEKEAELLEEELKTNYGFECEMVYNPTKKTMLDKLKYYNSIVTENDQILFFFTTHGYYDATMDSGFLIPADGESDDDYGESRLDYHKLQQVLSRSKAKHILLALDACHSGSFGNVMKGGPTRFPTKEKNCRAIVMDAMSKRGRQFCASGNQEAKTPSKSKFAARFLETLQQLDKDKVLYFGDLTAQLTRILDPKPVHGEFLDHEQGLGFVFVRKNSCSLSTAPDIKVPEDPERDQWDIALKENTVSGYNYYLDMHPTGRFRGDAIAERDWLKTVKINSCSGYRNYYSTYKRHKKEVEARCPLVGKSSPSQAGSMSDNMVFIKGGRFQMGSNNGEADELPIHEVTVSDFYINKYEVTQKEWREVMGKNPEGLKYTGCDQCAVTNVSWKEVQGFIYRLNKKTGQKYRLPTEAEWEYAAKGGHKSSTQRSNNSDINKIAWYSGNSEKQVHNIGLKLPNSLELYDMMGNVFEWCEDWYNRYTSTSKQNPKGGDASSKKVCRGGSYGDGKSYVSPTNRGGVNPEYSTQYIGFRLAKSAGK